MTFTELATAYPEHITLTLDSLMSVADVAAKTGKSVAWVKVQAARLGCRKVGSTWIFTPSDVTAMEE